MTVADCRPARSPQDGASVEDARSPGAETPGLLVSSCCPDRAGRPTDRSVQLCSSSPGAGRPPQRGAVHGPRRPPALPARFVGLMLCMSRSVALRGRRKPRRASPRLRKECLGREPGLTHWSAPLRSIPLLVRCDRTGLLQCAHTCRRQPRRVMRQPGHRRTTAETLSSNSICTRTRKREDHGAGQGSRHDRARRSWCPGTRARKLFELGAVKHP